MKTITRENYSKRVERVLEYITAHLDEDLDLQRLADQAFLSPYHFHRVYVAMMGESVADTIKRRREWSAAVKLISSAAPIAKIASEAGYRSTQAFGRAFREAYGVTPAQYRLHGQLSHAMQQRAQAAQKAPVSFRLEDVSIQAQLEVRVLALKHVGDYQLIGRTFERLVAWTAGKGLLEMPMRLYGIYYDDPLSRPKEELVSEACIAPARGANLDAIAEGDIRALTIAAGRCATYLFKGPYAELDQPYRWLYRAWLPESGEQPGIAPLYEEYLNDARVKPPTELLTRICLPLKD